MKDRTDWKRVRKMTEEELEAAIASDPDSDPPVDWSKAFRGLPDLPGIEWEKEKISLRIDKDILGWLRGYGKGYQTRINAILRAAMQAQK